MSLCKLRNIETGTYMDLSMSTKPMLLDCKWQLQPPLRRPSHVCSATAERKTKRAPVHRQRISIKQKLQTPTIKPLPGPNELGCSHFPECSGCHLATSVFDPPIVTQAREFFASRGYNDFTTVSGPVHGWRCRARLAVRGKPGSPVIGLFKRGTHETVPIPECR